jgi:hypothetical protein
MLAAFDVSAAPVGPYHLDAKNKCHAGNGQFAAPGLCKALPKTAPLPKHCKDVRTGKLAKCGALGAVPA